MSHEVYLGITNYVTSAVGARKRRTKTACAHLIHEPSPRLVSTFNMIFFRFELQRARINHVPDLLCISDS